MTATIFSVFVLLLVIRMPVSFSLAISAAVALVFAGSMDPLIVVQRMYTSVESFSLVAIPFFILSGGFMESGGISRRLISFSSSLVGHIRGGLSMISIVAAMFFAGISGSTAADTAAIGSVLIPAMEQKGYGKDLATSVVGTAGAIGIIIPPSIPMVILGITGSISIGGLFLGGVFPVRTGQERAVLDLCAEADPLEICAWAGALTQPPRIVHRPGMIDSMFDRDAIQSALDEFGDADEATVMAQLNAELSRQVLPGEGNGAFLEIVAEGKIPQHLEERSMPGGTSHLVEVVVLAACPNARLTSGRAGVIALFPAEKDILELVHAGVREHERRITTGNDRRSGNPAVSVPFEITEKSFSNIVREH